jgi:hypothetical protein
METDAAHREVGNSPCSGVAGWIDACRSGASAGWWGEGMRPGQEAGDVGVARGAAAGPWIRRFSC